MCIQLSLCAYYYHYVHTTVSMCILLSLCVYYCLYVYTTISILLPRNLCLKSEIKFLVAQGKKTWELKVNDYQITPSPIHVIARKRNGWDSSSRSWSPKTEWCDLGGQKQNEQDLNVPALGSTLDRWIELKIDRSIHY